MEWNMRDTHQLRNSLDQLMKHYCEKVCLSSLDSLTQPSDGMLSCRKFKLIHETK